MTILSHAFGSVQVRCHEDLRTRWLLARRFSSGYTTKIRSPGWDKQNTVHVYTRSKYPINFTAPLLGVDLPEIIPDEYIIVFEPIDRVSSEQGVEKLARDNAS